MRETPLFYLLILDKKDKVRSEFKYSTYEKEDL